MIALVLTASLVAGCGGSSGDQALADKAVLRSDDLPSPSDGLGWYADAPDPTSISTCVDFDLPGRIVTANAASDFFVSSDYGMVTSLAARMRSRIESR